MNYNNRVEWIDIAKGIAIILMVIGHTSIPPQINNWIFSFHMPFFFYISGLLTKININHSDFTSFVYHKTKTILKPFLIYSIINIILYPLYGEYPIYEYLKSVLYNGWGGIALWFVPVFFISVIICHIILMTRLSIYLYVVLFSIIGIILSYYKIQLPWSLSTVPIAIVYVMLGVLSQAFLQNFYKIIKTPRNKIVLSIICLVVSVLISSFYRQDLASNTILPFFALLVASISGICFLCILSISFNNKILSYIGRHTFEIMAFSQVIILIINANLSLNSVLRYIILIVVLYIICKSKDYLKSINIL